MTELPLPDPPLTVALPGGGWARFTGRAQGDMGHGGAYVHDVSPQVAARRRAVLDLPWTWLRQVHGDTVVTVSSPGEGAGARADAAVTARPGCALAVFTADCAPVALASPEGVLGAAHAGWGGLLAGVLERTVDAMAVLGAGALSAVVGPCIEARCYEFGTEDLERVAASVGPEVRARTADGRPALDLVAGARAALARAGVENVDVVGRCTACSPAY
ncbi:MAG TPA: polyphenol oxidase family protein, partial [Acidimicrobiales bacterium]|nr:polyphenol oxidase family protein [Acidimicrobiales bacterium]